MSAKTYEEVELDSEIMTASSHRLIQMLFDKTLFHLRQAEVHFEHNPEAFTLSINKAIGIIIYLRSCLSHNDEASFYLEQQLDALYLFSHRSLIQVSLKPNGDLLGKIKQIITNLKEGWDGIAEK